MHPTGYGLRPPPAGDSNARRHMPRASRTALIKTALQIFAILCLVLLLAMVVHKALTDMSSLARQYSGTDFWVALARQVLRTLAGS